MCNTVYNCLPSFNVKMIPPHRTPSPQPRAKRMSKPTEKGKEMQAAEARKKQAFKLKVTGGGDIGTSTGGRPKPTQKRTMKQRATTEELTDIDEFGSTTYTNRSSKGGSFTTNTRQVENRSGAVSMEDIAEADNAEGTDMDEKSIASVEEVEEDAEAEMSQYKLNYNR